MVVHNLCAIVLLTTLLASPAAMGEPGQQRDEFVSFSDYKRGKSDTAYERVEAGLASIPSNIRKALLYDGYTVLIAPTQLSANPERENSVPRGWDENSNYDNVGGLFEPLAKRILIPEQIQSRKNGGQYLPNNDIARTIRHEMGHAYDHYQGYASRTEEFMEAHTEDKERLGAEDQQTFAYFIQPNEAGFSELFAELFAAAYTPASDSSSRDQSLRKAFPRTTAVMLKLTPDRPKISSIKAPQPPKSMPSSNASESGRQAKLPDGQNSFQGKSDQSIVALYHRVATLMAEGKYTQAEPVMAQYVALMERNTLNHQSSPERLQATYYSYGKLLSTLHKDAEAKRILDKASVTPRRPTSAEVQSSFENLFTSGVVGFKFGNDGEEITITEVFPGTPAAKAGLQRNDRIIAVDGQDFGKNPTMESIYAKIRGPVGSTVSVTLTRGSSKEKITVKLTRVSLKSVGNEKARREYLEQK